MYFFNVCPNTMCKLSYTKSEQNYMKLWTIHTPRYLPDPKKHICVYKRRACRYWTGETQQFVILNFRNNSVRVCDFDGRVNEKLIFVLHLPRHVARTSCILPNDSRIHVVETLKLGHVILVVLALMLQRQSLRPVVVWQFLHF